MIITRRQFLKLVAGATAFMAVPIPAFSRTRKPYVFEGEVVNYIGSNCPGGFIGGQIVKGVKGWDGVGYPVELLTNGYPGEIEMYYDFDLANFRREIPDKFWGNPINVARYNNVHTYLRVQRFGETIEQAARKLRPGKS